MKIDLSRDFLDGIYLQQPVKTDNAGDIKVNGGLHFLPSSPDGTMHTAIVGFSLQLDGMDQPFARGGWRVLFTTDEQFDPKADQNNPFLRGVLVMGASKLMAQFNNLCRHANMPLIPFDPSRLVQSPSTQAKASGGESDEAAGQNT